MPVLSESCCCEPAVLVEVVIGIRLVRGGQSLSCWTYELARFGKVKTVGESSSLSLIIGRSGMAGSPMMNVARRCTVATLMIEHPPALPRHSLPS